MSGPAPGCPHPDRPGRSSGCPDRAGDRRPPGPEKEESRLYVHVGARERSPGSPPALLPAGRPGSEAPHDPRGPWGPRGRPDEPAGGGPEGLREGQNAQEPAYRLVHSVHRFTEFIGFTGSQVHRLRVESLQAHRGARFPSSFFVRFPHRVGRVRGSGWTLPEDRGSGWVVRMSGPGGPALGPRPRGPGRPCPAGGRPPARGGRAGPQVFPRPSALSWGVSELSPPALEPSGFSGKNSSEMASLQDG